MKNLILIIVLLLMVPSEQKVCPIQKVNYSDENCNQVLNNDYPKTMSVDDTSSNNSNNNIDCQIIEDGLYKASCMNNDSNIITFTPCFSSNTFIQNKDRTIGTCYSYRNGRGDDSRSYKLFGSCEQLNTTTNTQVCPLLETSSPTNQPTSSPTFTPAASIKLIPPFSRNEFADNIILSTDIAYESVLLAGRLIYQIFDINDAKDLLQPLGYDVHSFYDKGSTEAMVISTEHRFENNGQIKEKGKIIIVFRGTDETLDGDWLTNVNLPKVNFGPKGRILKATVQAPGYFGEDQCYDLQVHRGFNGVFSDGLYDEILNDIEPLLRRTIDNGQRLYYDNTVYFYGHSLGGANAQLFATYYAFFHEDVKTYVTSLGAPRQGNYAYKIFAESLPNLSIWRLVNCRDVVPRVPLFQYYHAGHLMWKRCNPPDGEILGNDVVEAYYRQSGDEEQKLTGTPPEFLVRQYEETIISDHLGLGYLEWLEYARGNGNNKNWTAYFQSKMNYTQLF